MKSLRQPNYLRLTATVLALYCLLLVMFPGFIMEKLSIAHSPTGALFMQFLGASLGGHVYLNWRAANADNRFLQAVILMNIVALALAVAVSLISIVNRTVTTPGLLILGMHLAFLLGFLLARKGLH